MQRNIIVQISTKSKLTQEMMKKMKEPNKSITDVYLKCHYKVHKRVLSWL